MKTKIHLSDFYIQIVKVMLQYTDIHLSDLKNLSVKSFTQVLINDIYPFIYHEINRLNECIGYLKSDYDVELLESTQSKIYSEFDELYRKEKLVLFPYIIKLNEENEKSENCAPFKNTKTHFTSMVHHLSFAKEVVSNFFITDSNNEYLNCLNQTLTELKETITEIQFIKEKHFYNPHKSCGGCNIKHTNP